MGGLFAKSFFNTVKTKFLGFTLDEHHFATQCKQICHSTLFEHSRLNSC